MLQKEGVFEKFQRKFCLKGYFKEKFVSKKRLFQRKVCFKKLYQGKGNNKVYSLIKFKFWYRNGRILKPNE